MTRNEILEAACQFYSPETVTEREIAFARHMVKWTLSEREWVGLTDEEIKEIIGPWGPDEIKGFTRKLFDEIEAKLKEKNA